MKRSPTLVYLLVWLSIGFYAVYWFLDSLRFLNGYRPVGIFNIRRLAWIVEELGVVPESLRNRGCLNG